MITSFVAALALGQAAPVRQLPDFRLPATDGKTWTRSALLAKPTLFVFLNPGCPHNPQAVPHLVEIRKQLGARANFVGVTSLGLAEAKAYAKKLRLSIPVIADAKSALIEGAGATHSLDLAFVGGRKGQVGGYWNGISRAALVEASALLKKQGVKSDGMSFAKIPERRMSGCGF